MKSIQSSFYLLQLSSIILLTVINPVAAEVTKHHSGLDSTTQIKESQHQVSISIRDLVTQERQRDEGTNRQGDKSRGTATDLVAKSNLTRVTGVEVNQTTNGLELVLKTAAGSERLVPLILPEGNDLVIDILDATLAFSIRNGVRESNPAPGIRSVALTKVDDSSIRLTITGEKQAPSAEVIPSNQNLVLSINPQETTARQTPDQEIEVIATGEAEDDDYNIDEANTATRTDTPLRDIPQSIQVVPQQVIEDRNTETVIESTETVSGVVYDGGFADAPTGSVIIRGFSQTQQFRNGFRDTDRTGLSAIGTVDRVEILKGPGSVLFGNLEPGGIVNVVTKQLLREPFYELSFEAGNRSFFQPGVDLSGPFNDDKSVLYRLIANYQSSDSFQDFANSDITTIAPSLTFNLGERTRACHQLKLIQPDDSSSQMNRTQKVDS